LIYADAALMLRDSRSLADTLRSAVSRRGLRHGRLRSGATLPQ